jgi:2,4-dienoyl-CoA reductase-like NADH-dependent reductase (Old Yellow Enzyme family)
MYDHLFLPLKVGMTELPNRICLLAHRTNFGRGGLLNDRHIAYYRRRAEGGCGLIVVGELAIHPDDRPWETLIDTRHPEIGASFRRLTGAIHEFDTRVFAQLKHHGFQSNGNITRKAIWGPSAISDIVFGEVCKPMEPEDFAELTDAFVHSAVRVKEGGFDGVEIDMGPESLLRQFLSPICNHRRDEYGGSLEKLTRTIHEYDGKIFAQLNHNGMQGDSKLSRLPVWGRRPERIPSSGKPVRKWRLRIFRSASNTSQKALSMRWMADSTASRFNSGTVLWCASFSRL